VPLSKVAHQPRNERQQVCPYLCSEGPASPLYICLSAGLVGGHHDGLYLPVLVVRIPGTAGHDAPVLHNVVRQDLPAGNIKDPNSAFALLGLLFNNDYHRGFSADFFMLVDKGIFSSTRHSQQEAHYDSQVSKGSFSIILLGNVENRKSRKSRQIFHASLNVTTNALLLSLSAMHPKLRNQFLADTCHEAGLTLGSPPRG